MLLSIIEFPIAALYVLTGEKSKKLNRLIKRLNRSRMKSLEEYGEDTWILEDYDGEENVYKYLERHRTTCNLIALGYLSLIVGAFLLFAHFGIAL